MIYENLAAPLPTSTTDGKVMRLGPFKFTIGYCDGRLYKAELACYGRTHYGLCELKITRNSAALTFLWR
jgi:hypothetical protein